MPKDIVVSVPNTDPELASTLESLPNLNAVKLSGAGMDGGGQYLVFLIPLSHFAVKTIVDLVKAHWEKAGRIKVEIEGMTFSGASLDEISHFLDKHPPSHDTK